MRHIYTIPPDQTEAKAFLEDEKEKLDKANDEMSDYDVKWSIRILPVRKIITIGPVEPLRKSPIFLAVFQTFKRGKTSRFDYYFVKSKKNVETRMNARKLETC